VLNATPFAKLLTKKNY